MFRIEHPLRRSRRCDGERYRSSSIFPRTAAADVRRAQAELALEQARQRARAAQADAGGDGGEIAIDETTCREGVRGAWNWEAGFDRDMVDEAEAIRDLLLRAIYGNWSYLVNRGPRRADYARRRLAWVGYVLGKRESRRLLGDVIYSQHDLAAETPPHHDACVPCRWGIDLHYPQPEQEALLGKDCFRSIARHGPKNRHPTRWLPYRSLYSRNIANCFVAGRCASMTHVAHAYFRNQCTTGMMGEVVGLAAALALERGCTQREVATRYWPELRRLLARGTRPGPGTGPPEETGTPG